MCLLNRASNTIAYMALPLLMLVISYVSHTYIILWTFLWQCETKTYFVYKLNYIWLIVYVIIYVNKTHVQYETNRKRKRTFYSMIPRILRDEWEKLRNQKKFNCFT